MNRALAGGGLQLLFVLSDASALRDCLKIMRGAVFVQKALWRGATKEHSHRRSATEEQRSQRTFCAKTLRAAGLLPVDCVGSVRTARCGDARTSPPCPQPKSLAAAPLRIFRQSLRWQSTNFPASRISSFDLQSHFTI